MSAAANTHKKSGPDRTRTALGDNASGEITMSNTTVAPSPAASPPSDDYLARLMPDVDAAERRGVFAAIEEVRELLSGDPDWRARLSRAVERAAAQLAAESSEGDR